MQKTIFSLIMLATISLTHDMNASTLLLVGSYNTVDDEAIGIYTFDQQTGEFSYLKGVRGIGNPSFMCTNVANNMVYAVSEYDDPQQSSLTSYKFNKTTGSLSQVSTHSNNAASPCNVILSPSEQYAICANYGGGSMTIFPISPDGQIKEPTAVTYQGSGPHPNQTQPHIHAINFTPDERFLLANDLGLDCIHVYPLSSTSNTNDLPLIDTEGGYDIKVDPGAGPRHLCWSPDGRFAYLLSELSGQIYTLSYDGQRLEVERSLVADTLQGGGSADIHITADGCWLYASHRLKGDGISIYHVNKQDGTLQRVGYQSTGIHPRNFAITPNDRYLLVACRDSDAIEIYERDMDTGLLRNTGRMIKFHNPVFLKFID